MMPTYKPGNSVPAVWWSGLKDESIRAQTYESPIIPIHAPLFMTFAPYGQTVAQFVSGGTAQAHYGSEIFDVRSKYATIVTPFLTLMNQYANPYLLQRLRPTDAGPESTLCLALKVVKTDKLIEYRRDAYGNYVYDENAHPIETSVTNTGYYAEWTILPVRDGAIGEQSKSEGEAIYRNDTTALSTIYPIIEFKARWFGEQGNNLGIRLYAPTKTNNKTSATVMNATGAYTYGIEVVRRPDPRSKPRTVKNYYGQDITYFTFKEDTFHEDMGGIYSLSEILEDRYSDMVNINAPAKYSDIGDIHIYHEYLDEVLNKFFIQEQPFAQMNELVDADPNTGSHLINILTGKDFNNVPYHRIQIGASLNGATVTMGATSTHYFTGGSDGTMGNDAYDAAVRAEFEQFGKLETKFDDIGRYPFHQVYDVGFTIKTKLALTNALMVRQDVNVTLSTVDVISNKGLKMPDNAAEANIGATLVTAIRNMPESEKWGTPAYRGIVIPGGSKLMNNTSYRRFVPATYEVAAWRAEYMAQPAGFKPDHGYDQPPYNHVRHLDPRHFSNSWAPASDRERNWANGICHWRWKTDRIIFNPGLKTVYSNDTSVLTSDITLQATCDLNYYGYVVWSNLTGNSKLSNEELCQISNEMFDNYTLGRYDDRFRIIPNTHLTKEDETNGWSWTNEVAFGARNMKTQSEMYLIAHRFEDLADGQ